MKSGIATVPLKLYKQKNAAQLDELLIVNNIVMTTFNYGPIKNCRRAQNLNLIILCKIILSHLQLSGITEQKLIACKHKILERPIANII